MPVKEEVVTKRPIIAILILILASFALAACQPEPDMGEMMEEGEQLYIVNCSRCHQLEGEGTADFPALAGNPVVTLHNSAPMIDVVLHGRGGMPAFRGVLEDEEVVAVLTYIRNSWGNSAPPVPEKQVR
jgi:mono/diheme cytochrome c family protein